MKIKSNQRETSILTCINKAVTAADLNIFSSKKINMRQNKKSHEKNHIKTDNKINYKV